MKYRNKPCQVCGDPDKSKRKVCLNCKKRYPLVISQPGQGPFNRHFLRALNLRKKKK